MLVPFIYLLGRFRRDRYIIQKPKNDQISQSTSSVETISAKPLVTLISPTGIIENDQMLTQVPSGENVIPLGWDNSQSPKVLTPAIAPAAYMGSDLPSTKVITQSTGDLFSFYPINFIIIFIFNKSCIFINNNKVMEFKVL